MKTIAITGSLGHIGSKLIHSFQPGQFKEIRLIDNLSTQRYASLFNLPQKVNFKFIEEDILKANLKNYFKDIDIVIHLAAMTDAASSFGKRELVERVNYIGTKKVVQACLINHCKLIFPSTTSVYGSQKTLVNENCLEEDLKPQSPYAQSKLKAEKLLLKLGKERGLKFIIYRFGTIFGPSIGMRFHTAVNKFIWQAVNGQPITVWKTALHQKRPYLDLNDAIQAIYHTIDKKIFTNEIYNVLTLNATVSDILRQIKKIIPQIKVNYVDNPIMNQLSYVVDNEKFNQTGFKYRGSFEKGINNTIKLLKGIL